MTTQTTNGGYEYLMARAKDGIVAGALEEIGRCEAKVQVVLEDQARRQLDDLILSWHDGRPTYTAADVTRAAREIYGRQVRA